MATGTAGMGQVYGVHRPALAMAQASRLMDGLQRGCWLGSTPGSRGFPLRQALGLLRLGQHDSAHLVLRCCQLAEMHLMRPRPEGGASLGLAESGCEQLVLRQARPGRRQRGLQTLRAQVPVCVRPTQSSQQQRCLARTMSLLWLRCPAGGPGEPSCTASGSADM